MKQEKLCACTSAELDVVFECLLFIIFVFSATGGGCTLGDLRLMGGTNSMEGRVEICIDGVWGTVSDDGWSTVDAQIACRQLGFAAAGMYAHLVI